MVAISACALRTNASAFAARYIESDGLNPARSTVKDVVPPRLLIYAGKFAERDIDAVRAFDGQTSDGIHAIAQSGRQDHVFKTMLLLPPDRYKTAEQVTTFFRPVLERVRAIPGVTDAAESSSVPPDNSRESKVEISGKSPDDQWHAQVQNVSETYFRVLRIPFERGRGFTEAEINDARKVAVVNRKFVSTYLSGEDPIGRRVKLMGLESVADSLREPSFEIVGVVRRHRKPGCAGLRQGRPAGSY